MKRDNDFYLVSSPIRAKIRVKDFADGYLIGTKLPSEYSLDEHSIFSFPAGEENEYVVFDGLMYDFDKYESLENIKEVIGEKLKEGEFKESEIKELLDSIKPRSGMTKYLDLEQSGQWLKLHPQYQEEAMKVLEVAISEAEQEINEAKQMNESRKMR